MTPIDPDLTPETAALHRHLSQLAGRSLLIGHQDDLAYGNDWWAEPDRSDVREVTGAYPAVFGWDVGHLETQSEVNIDGVPFADLTRYIQRARGLGAVNTISWHSVDPVSGGGYGSPPTPGAIASVLPGGPRHGFLVDSLDLFAGFVKGLVDDAGKPVPIVFRPYHEHSGDWFWWCVGNGLNTVSDYRALWAFTIEYLRHEKGLHNILYAVSPDRSRLDLDRLAEEYLAIYPGDEYVDILGLDNYWDVGHQANPTPRANQYQHYVQSIRVLSQLAAERGKIAALTETAVPHDVANPWTEYLLKAVLTDRRTRQIVWALVWRNTYRAAFGGSPRPGSPTAPDFTSFRHHPYTAFADDLPDLYSGQDGSAGATTMVPPADPASSQVR